MLVPCVTNCSEVYPQSCHEIKMATGKWGTSIFSSTDAYGDKILIDNFSIKKEDIKL